MTRFPKRWRRATAGGGAAAALSLSSIVQSHDPQFDTMSLGSVGGLSAAAAMADTGQTHLLAGGGLHCLRQAANLGRVIRVGRRNVQRRQLARRIHGQMQVGSLRAPGAIIPGSLPTFG
jgi:hypothetical protein